MADVRPADARSSRRPTVPRSFQTRLTFAFIGVVALTLALVAPIVINRIDDYFRQQEEQSLQVRAKATAAVIDQFIETTLPGHRVVAEADGQAVLNPDVARHPGHARPAADRRRQRGPGGRDLVSSGSRSPDTDGTWMPDPDSDLAVLAAGSTSRPSGARPATRRSRRPRPSSRCDRGRPALGHGRHPVQPVHGRARARSPRSRASSLVMAGVAFGVAVLVAAFLARRFTTPADAPDRGLAPAGRGRPVVARAGGRGRRRAPPSCARCRCSSTRWPTGSSRASRSSAATATTAATSSPT